MHTRVYVALRAACGVRTALWGAIFGSRERDVEVRVVGTMSLRPCWSGEIDLVDLPREGVSGAEMGKIDCVILECRSVGPIAEHTQSVKAMREQHLTAVHFSDRDHSLF